MALTETALLPPKIEATVEQLLRLPEAQRLAISRRLAAGIDLDEIDEAWSQEIARRIREIETGAVQGTPSGVVRREMEALIGEKL